MAEYKGLTIKFTGDDTDLTRALMNIENKADDTQKTLSLIGSGKGLGLKQGGDALKSFGDSISKLGDKLTIISGTMLLTFGRKMVQSVQEFGNEISRVGGYLGIEGEQLENMRELALKFGKDTQYSATEAAQAISELAKGGLTDAQISAGALDSTLQLAAAGQLDFGTAAKVTAQALKAFSLEAEDTTQVADALAGAASNSVASVEGIATGFTYAASWARNAGWSINDVSGALALLADYGIDAEMGGTALRNVMLRLAAPTDKAAALMKDLGIEVRDSYGNMKSITEVVDELNVALANVTPDEKDSIISAIFGVRGANAALALLDAGSEKLRTYIGYTRDVGAASRMAKAQMGELGWAIELMRGEAETASVNFMESLEPTLIRLANAAEDVFSWFNELSDAERDSVVQTALWVVGAGPMLSIVGRLISGFGGVASAIGSATMGISAFAQARKVIGADFIDKLGAAFSAMKFTGVKEGISAVTAGMMGLSTAIAGVGAALGLLFIGAFVKMLIDTSENAKRAAERVKLLEDSASAVSDAARNTAPSLERAKDAYAALGEAADTSADAVDGLLEKHLDLADTIASRNEGVQETINLLSTARNIIDEFAGSESLAAEDVAKLQWALDLVNQETGHNYELMYANSGVIGENGEAVDNLVESLDSLIDARMREAQAAAISANMTDLYKEKYELERSKTAAEQELARLHATAHQIELDMADEDRYSVRYREMSDALDDVNGQISTLEQSVGGLDGALRDNADGLAYYEDAYAGLVGVVETTQDKIGVIMNSLGGEQFGALGDRAEEFVGRIDSALSKAGAAQLDYTSMTQSQWDALVTALNADGYYMEDMLVLVTGNLDLASGEWRAILEQWADDNGLTADEAMTVLSEGIKNGELDVTNGLTGVLESAIGSAQEYARTHAGEVGNEAVEAIKSPLRDVDSRSWGQHLMENYINGIKSKIRDLDSAARMAAEQGIALRMAQTVAKKGVLHYTDKWGVHLIENYINGMRSKIPELARTSEDVANTIAWGVNDNSLYMSAGTGNASGTVINIDGNAIVTDARMRAAADSFLQEVARKADM